MMNDRTDGCLNGLFHCRNESEVENRKFSTVDSACLPEQTDGSKC